MTTINKLGENIHKGFETRVEYAERESHLLVPHGCFASQEDPECRCAKETKLMRRRMFVALCDAQGRILDEVEKNCPDRYDDSDTSDPATMRLNQTLRFIIEKFNPLKS